MILLKTSSKSSLPNTRSTCFRCLVRLSNKRNVSSRQILGISPALGDVTVKVNKTNQEYFFTNRDLPSSRTQYQQLGSVAQLHNDISYKSWIAPKWVLPSSVLSLLSPKSPRNPLSTLQSSHPPQRYWKRLKERLRPNPALEATVPPDASSRLASLSTSLPTTSVRRLLTICLSLSKPRLSFLIVLTTAAAYSIYPIPALQFASTNLSPSLSTLTLLFLTAGTALCCASANALNMLLEPQYDAQMSRTRNRPIVRGLIGKRGAFIFASLAGTLGIGSLWCGVNPTVAFLGWLNIFLYAGAYTPMKRMSVLNTWVGALVGGIPPLMGWTAAAAQSITGTPSWKELLFSEDSIGGWLLAGLLFAWQFPHFNALSWSIRDEYRKAGLQMLAWRNPAMNGRVALRYSLFLFPLCAGLVWFQIADSGFLVTSSIANAWLMRQAWRFWSTKGHKGSARALFWTSVWYLPVVMVLAMAHKKGLWEGIWRSMTDQGQDEDIHFDLEELETKEREKGRQSWDQTQPLGTAMT